MRIFIVAALVAVFSCSVVAAQSPPPGFYKWDGTKGRDNFCRYAAYSQCENGPGAIQRLSSIYINGKWKERAVVGVISHDPNSDASAIYAYHVDGLGNSPHGFTHATKPDTVFSSPINDARNLDVEVFDDIAVFTWEQQEGSRWVTYSARIDTKMQTPVWVNLSGTPLNPAFPTKVNDVWSPDVYDRDVKLIPGTADPAFAWVFQYLDPNGPREVHYLYWTNGQLNTLGTGGTSRMKSYTGSVYSLPGIALTLDPKPNQGFHEPHIFAGIELTPGVYDQVRHDYYSVSTTAWVSAASLPAGTMGPLQADWTNNSHQLVGQSYHSDFGYYVWVANGSVTAPTATTLDWGEAFTPSIAQTANGKIEVMYFDETNAPAYNSEVRCAERVPLGTFKGIDGAVSFSRVSNDWYTDANPSVALNSVRKPMGVWTVKYSATYWTVVGAMYQY